MNQSHDYWPAPAYVRFLDDGHNGPGWYYWSEDSCQKDAIGAFTTRLLADVHAYDNGYTFSDRLNPKEVL